MEDRESGSLSRKPALDLLMELHQGSVTGSLKLERAPLQKAVYFRDGQILFAASNDPKDQLASILVEEGKLGPDQMQVAQARVSPGNPLAKVLTELGYISQRELADAARIKVEKILTDLYGWTEGTYQFATKSLPKGAIDLELSTARLLFASIRRVQDREWVLRQLGSLEAVVSPARSIEEFIEQIHADPLSAEVLRLADGVKNVKQIGVVSSLSEFDVCKVLAGGIVAGALRTGGPGAGVSASEEAFSFPPTDLGHAAPPSFGAETVGLPVLDATSPESTTFPSPHRAEPAIPEPVPESEETVFSPPPMGGPRSAPSFRTAPPPEPRRSRPTELVIDEPEPATSDGPRGRRTPRAKPRSGGGGSPPKSGNLKWAGAAILAAGAVFAVYHFVWPLLGSGGGAKSAANSGSQVSATPAGTPGPSAPTTSAPGSLDPAAGAATPAPVAPTPDGSPTASTSTPPSGELPTPGPVTAPPPSATTSEPPSPTPAPPSGDPRPVPTSGSGGQALLRGGDIPGAARAFQQEVLATGSDKFTIAIGLYCNEDNVDRIVSSAGGSSEIFVLPTSVEGRSCYRVIWGLFETREAAERGLGALPAGIQAGDAAAVPLARFLP